MQDMESNKVLVHETDRSVLEVLTLALEDEGFTVMGHLGFDAGFMEAIDRFRPHVVMLDYRLGGEESVRVCETIKQKYPHLPVLALSCNSNINLEYDQKGFDDYIRKPFDLSILYTILRKHINAARHLQA
jgi:DNA-binding response OmpR family regulator